jgi:hypothetical protein
MSVSMNDEAYQIYKEWQKGTRSNKLSAAIMQWNALKDVKWTVKE